ncbi:MAG: GntR family transcriptional regulator [Dongiaceae bacterium]
MPFNIDPDLPVPLGVQLRGVIEYGIVCGQLPAGLRLPPVRAMASQLNIAPMTVSQVYKELKDAGLLETKPGHGTFVSASIPDQVRPAILDLQLRVDQLLHDATAAGLSAADLVGLINARINRRTVAGKGLRLVFVGLFEEATKAYGADIQAKLPDGDVITTTTMSEVASNDLARQRTLNADLVLTLANRKADVAEMLGPKQRILGINYIPSERTRTQLAQIDPLARVCIVSTFPEFLPIMKAGVQRFAPHVQSIKATVLDSPDLKETLASMDVVVLATGSERAIRLLKRGTAHFEYRHTPDPWEIDQVLLPMLETIRGAFPAPTEPAQDLRRSHEN